MSAKTGLAPWGSSQANNASYAGKTGKAAGVFSRLHPGGHSRAWALDNYAGKAPGFPTQFFGLKAYDGVAIVDLCLVATADAPVGIGGQVRVPKNGTTYAVYLVDSGDPNASNIPMRTTTATKYVRLKT